MNLLPFLSILLLVVGQYRVTSNNNYIFCHDDSTILASGNLCNTYITFLGQFTGESRYAYSLNNVSNTDIIVNLPMLNSYNNNDNCIKEYTSSLVTFVIKQYGACTISIYPYDQTLADDITQNLVETTPDNIAVNSSKYTTLSTIILIIPIFFSLIVIGV